MKRVIAVLFFSVLFSTSFAAPVTVEAIGEAQIVRSDLASAKIQAESRARWAGMEKAAQVKVSVESVIHNAEMLDELVKSEVKGSVTAFKVIDEGKDGDIYWVQAKVTVEPEKAQNILGGLSMNTKIVVYLPLVGVDGSVEETHHFSEKVINELRDKGFEVVDLASDDQGLSNALSKAVQKNDMAAVRAMASKYMASYALVGKVTVVDKGQDTGYGASPFKMVNGEAAYRLIGGQGDSKAILANDTITNRGQGPTHKDAAQNVSKNLANKDAVQLASKVSTALLGNNKKSVRLVLTGNRDMGVLNDFRDMVKNIAWVLNVKEAGTDALTIEYPEKTLYLATIIGTKGYKVTKFTDTEIIVSSR